ncbi:MAG: MmgE/PrpD family protein [Chloroflexi bacterium]|nr:MmgE/PrpD family protein [Chloroflexota bacterium]
MSDRYSKLFASYAHNVSWEDLPPDTVHEVKRRVLDSIGVAIAAFGEDAPKAVRSYAYDFATNGKGATLWGVPVKAAPEVATFANGVSVRYLDYNDTYLSLEPLHPSDMIPGLMALCQWGEFSVRDLITAIAVGYEISVNLCDAASLRAHRWDHVVYTGTGAAAGAGRLLGLGPSKIEDALSIAIVPHASMRQTRAGELSMWKGAAAANSVRNAVFAALVARKGLTGPYQPFEGEMGFFRQLLEGDRFDDAALQSIEKNAAPTRIQDTYIKKWPVEYHAQSAVDAAIDLHEELGGDANLIESIRIDTFKAAYEIIAKDPEKWNPKTRETADHSIQYITVVALLDGIITKESFSHSKIKDSKVKALLGKVDLKEDDELTKGYPEGIPNRITVRTRDGGTLAREVSFPRGHARNKMSDAEVEQKFRLNVEWAYTPEQTERVIDLVMGLENQPDLEELMEAIRI